MMRRACPALFIVLLATIALPQSKIQSPSQRPLSLPDVVAFMSAGIQTPTVQALVQRGLDFAMTDSVAAGLKTCGATDDELQAMRPKQGASQKEWLPAYEKICFAMESGDKETAAEAMNALPQKPGPAAALYFFARIVRDTQSSEMALALGQKAVSLEPDIAENHTFLVTALLDSGAEDQALAEARTTVAKNPNLGEAHRVLGMALKQKGDAAAAIREFKEAVRLAPYSSKATVALSVALEESKDMEGAEQAYRAAVESNPNSFSAHYNYGLFLSDKKNDILAATAEYRKAVAINPKEPEGLTNLGAMLCDTGHHEEAIKVYATLFELYPHWDTGRECYAESLYYQGNFVESVKQAQIGSQQDPDSMVFEHYLGLSYLQLGNVEEGTALLLKVLAKQPQDPDAHLEAARALRLTHRETEAIQQYREAERLAPGNGPIITELAALLTTTGKEQLGVLEYEKAIPVMKSDKYTEWVHGLRQKMEEKKLPVTPATASAEQQGPLPPSDDSNFLHQHSNGDIQRLLDRILGAKASELEDWKRNPSLMGAAFTDLCTPYDKSLAQDMMRGAAMRFQDRSTAAGITEMTWATFQLMLARNTNAANLHALLDKSEQYAKTEPPPIAGVASILSPVAISMQRQMLDAPARGKMTLAPNYVACHLRTHPAPQFNRGQELELATPKIQVLATIGIDGAVTQVKVITKASDALAKIASDAVMQYKYDPIFMAGHAWEVDTVVDVSFK